MVFKVKVGAGTIQAIQLVTVETDYDKLCFKIMTRRNRNNCPKKLR
jgi:hypothetical protein